MGGTQRMLSLARYLPQFGWQPHILTVKDIAYHAHDPELLHELSSLPIVRTESLDLARVLARFQSRLSEQRSNAFSYKSWKNLFLRLINFFMIPDNKILWNPFAQKAACNLINNIRFDLILSSGPPHSSHLLAMKLAKKFQIPWVADFRDGWACGDFQQNRTRLHTIIDKRLQKEVLQKAHRIIAVSNGLAAALKAGQLTPVEVVTNGYNATDFDTDYQPTMQFEMLHVGSIGNFALPDIFLNALRKFVMEVGDNAIRMRFIGADITGELVQKIAAAGLTDYVQHAGYLVHKMAVSELQKADLLIYLVTGRPSQGFVPGKTFEYLAANRPVLAIAERVEGVQLLLRNGATRLADPNSEEEILQALRLFYDEYKKQRVLQPDPNFAKQYERKKLVNKMANIFDSVI